MRQVVLDTETTGLEANAGHRIIEIGCVELVNRRPTRRTFHRYLNPERAVDAGALEVHGIDDDFLATQPRFREVADEFLEFVRGAELVIHNADFDVEFINHELRRLEARAEIRDCCQVLDTLALARRMHPGQRNSLDALAKRYSVDNSKRELHGALLDAQILADIYLAMTGGQGSLLLDAGEEQAASDRRAAARIAREGLVLTVFAATVEERTAHAAFLERIRKKCGGTTVWDKVVAVGVASMDGAPVASMDGAPVASMDGAPVAKVGADPVAAKPAVAPVPGLHEAAPAVPDVHQAAPAVPDVHQAAPAVPDLHEAAPAVPDRRAAAVRQAATLA
jgi:DNA polymerase-3 subunit epsilon